MFWYLIIVKGYHTVLYKLLYDSLRNYFKNIFIYGT